jgi:hypothetical protein
VRAGRVRQLTLPLPLPLPYPYPYPYQTQNRALALALALALTPSQDEFANELTLMAVIEFLSPKLIYLGKVAGKYPSP